MSGAAGQSSAWVAVALWSVLAGGCSRTDEVVLRCDYGNRLQDVYSLHERARSVQLMSVQPARPGKLTVTDAAYQLEFPENDPANGYQLLKVDINRFTSKAEREIGREMTVTHEGKVLNLHAVRDSGECVRMKGKAF